MAGDPRTDPAVTVIIPTFDRERLVAQAARSALGQSFRDLEAIVVDDGSTDGTPSALNALAADDPRLRVIRQENRGPAAARNRGAAAARGKLLAFLDSDDLWDPGKLALQVEHLDAHPEAALTFCDARVEDERGAVAASRFASKGFAGDPSLRGIFEARFPLCTPSVLVRASAFREAGGFDEGLPCAEDWDLWIRLLERFPAVFIDRPLLTIRRGRGSLSRQRELEKWRSWATLWTRHEERLVAAGCDRAEVRRRQAHARRKIASAELRQGHLAEAGKAAIAWLFPPAR